MFLKIAFSAQRQCSISILRRTFNTSNVQFIDQKWRKLKDLPENPNSFGPLTNLPDYSYLDGRPVPLGSNMTRRLLKQQEVAQKIVTMCSELKYAKERYAQQKLDKELKVKRRKENLLMEKGPALLIFSKKSTK